MSLGHPTQITTCQTGAVSSTHTAALAIARRWPSRLATAGDTLLFQGKG